jgi:hypothetical protein
MSTHFAVMWKTWLHAHDSPLGHWTFSIDILTMMGSCNRDISEKAKCPLKQIL